MSVPTRTSLLWHLDRWFPPDQSAFMDGEHLTAHETSKAPGTMGRYLTELGRTDVDVLDFGCGWGGETLWLADRVRSVIGVDTSPEHLAQAERALRIANAGNCHFVLGTASIRSASVDAVFSTNTFEHVQDLPQAFAELFRVMKAGGSLIASWGPLFYSPKATTCTGPPKFHGRICSAGFALYWTCATPAHIDR